MKISYINSLCIKHDAISESIKNEIGWLIDEQHDVKFFGYECGFNEIPTKTVNDLRDVAFDKHFQTSDLIVFHFGIFYPLFNLLPVAPKNAKRLVIFHNITPKNLVSPENYSTIDRSFLQMTNIVFADHVACVSKTNLDVLHSHGIFRPATILPLAINSGLQAPIQKNSFKDKIIRIAFIGRFVQSKGPTEVIFAMFQLLKASKKLHFKLDLIGNLEFSNPKILAETKKAVSELLQNFSHYVEVQIHGNATEQLKHEILRNADIFILPTYHEGFCVPIVEAIASGCRVVSYDNSNIPAISGGFAELAPTGDIDCISDSLIRIVKEVSSEPWKISDNGGYAQYVRDTRNYVNNFSMQCTRDRFIDCINSLIDQKQQRNILS